MKFKLRGIVWNVYLAPWEEWHQRESEPRLRRAWWWLRRWPSKYGDYCFRVVGMTIHGRKPRTTTARDDVTA